MKTVLSISAGSLDCTSYSQDRSVVDVIYFYIPRISPLNPGVKEISH